jgi:uncharacterized membrane protein
VLPHAAFAALLFAVVAFAMTGEIAIRNAAEGGAIALMASTPLAATTPALPGGC